MKLAPLDTSTPFGKLRPTALQRLGWSLATGKWPPRIKRWLRRRVRGETGPFDVRVMGPREPNDQADMVWRKGQLQDRRLKFRAYPSENYCDRVLVGQGRLPEHREHFEIQRLNAVLPIRTFVDIGANVGTYSAFVGTIAPDARILAFEPHPRTAQKLRFNLAANGVDAEVIQAGVGTEPGTMQLWSDGGGNVGQTSLLPEATSNAKVSVNVEIVRLADALAERDIRHIDLLKIDVEGFEDRALSSLLSFSPNRQVDLPRAILLEEEHSALWQDDLLDRLRRLGYRETFRTRQNALHVLS